MESGIRDLLNTILTMQAKGDYAGVKAFMAKWAVLDPHAEQIIGSMDHIPVDIQPIYPEQI